MSALDDLIARDAAIPASGGFALDALIAKDGGVQKPATPNIQAAPEVPGKFATIGAGLGHGFGSTVLGAQQLLGHGVRALGGYQAGNWLINDANTGLKNLDSQNKPYSDANPLTSGASDIVGNGVATAPLIAATLPKAGATLGAKILSGMKFGAASGAIAPTANDEGSNFWGDKAVQVGIGTVAGGASVPLASALGNVISGAGGASQKMLAKAGVTMTPGQILGGALKATEDKLSSVPVLGDLIKNAQQRSVQDFNKATYNEVLKPLGQTYNGPIGVDGVKTVKTAISDSYDKALSKLHFDSTDAQFATELGSLRQLASSLPDSQQKTFNNIVKTQITDKIGPQGVMTGEQLKGVQQELGTMAKGYKSDPSFDNKQLGNAVSELKQSIQRSLYNTNPAGSVQDLAKADAAYANYVRLRAAASGQGAMNQGGVFSAAQLANAVRSSDKSAGKGSIATGDALMQKFATSGQEVLGSKYPDSGTAGRSLLGLGVAALAGHSYLPPAAMATAATLGAGAALPYTSAGQKLAQALLMRRPAGAQAVGDAVNRFAVPVAPLFGAALANSAQR